MSNSRVAKRILPGQLGRTELPYSEVCMHMRIAGTVCNFLLKQSQYPSVQLYRDDGSELSAPITTGEAGIYRDDFGYYYYPAEPAPN